MIWEGRQVGGSWLINKLGMGKNKIHNHVLWHDGSVEGSSRLKGCPVIKVMGVILYVCSFMRFLTAVPKQMEDSKPLRLSIHTNPL